MNMGYDFFYNYYTTILDNNSQLYTNKIQALQQLYGKFFIKQSFKYIAYEIGSHFFYYFSRILYRPSIQLFFNIEFKIKDFFWKIKLNYINSQITEGDSHLPYYILLDTYISYQIWKQFSIFLEGKNLINYKYQNRLLYQNSGLEVSGGIKISL